MAESAADVVKTKEYKKVRMTLAETMDMSPARSYAEGFDLITKNQMDDLRTTHEPKGRMDHNRELFRMMEVGGLQALRTFADDVLEKLGPQFAESRAKLMRLCGVGPASTSTNPAVSGADAPPAVADASQPRAVNGWKSQTYHRNYELLLMRMHPQDVRNKCKALSLLGDYELADVDAEGISHKKNAIILKVLESSPGLFGTFREILHCITNCRDIAMELDAVGPNRTTDQGCLAARNVLEKGGNVSTD